jgi:deoxyribonuclease IV
MKTHRVRSLIRYLNSDYARLRDDKILPKQLLFTKVPRGGKLPTLAGHMGYSSFGLFMEKIIECSLVHHRESVEDAVVRCKIYLDEGLHRFFKPEHYIDIGNMVREHFYSFKRKVKSSDISNSRKRKSGTKSFHDLDIPTFEPEIFEKQSYNGEDIIVGHPDIVSKDCVYDIKTTGRFNGKSMRIPTIYQILSYYCLAKINKRDVTHIGLILPGQLRIFYVDMGDWDWKKFWKEVQGCIAKKYYREGLYNATPDKLFSFQMWADRIGQHVRKTDVINYLEYERPFQFFIGGNSSTKTLTLTKKMVTTLKNRSKNIPGFIHSPYCLNLSRPNGNKEKMAKGDEENPWVWRITRQILELGESCGLDGVVIHCGKKVDLKERTALRRMRRSVRHIVDDGKKNVKTYKCKLLIETSAGETGELLSDPNDLSDFYWSLDKYTRRRVAICVDTCHVFAAGYDPAEFVAILHSRNVPIKLFHFNDSEHPIDSHVDAHARIGDGYVGIESLYDVLSYAIFNNIPCVTE